jgi:hypothetical protein
MVTSAAHHHHVTNQASAAMVIYGVPIRTINMFGSTQSNGCCKSIASTTAFAQVTG